MDPEVKIISASDANSLNQEIICTELQECNGIISNVYKFSNGDIYIGKLINGNKQGYGKFMRNNGDIYEGNWANDLIQYSQHKFAKGGVYKGE